jgi:rare lipoprotein A
MRKLALCLLVCGGCAAAQGASTIAVHGGGDVVTQRQEGMASWYGREQHGQLTANGERFDMRALTAAHKTLKMHTRVRVTNKLNGRQVTVRINDRGPYSRGRIIDLSMAAAQILGMIERGVVPVLVEVLR